MKSRRLKSRIYKRLVLRLGLLVAYGAARSVAACFSPLGMENKDIPDSNITHSSKLHHGTEGYHARLNGKGHGWQPSDSDKHPWIQIFLKKKHLITGFAIDLDKGLILRRVKYYLTYSVEIHGKRWQNYTENDQLKLYEAYDFGTNVYNLSSPFTTQYVRLYLKRLCFHRCYLKMELYGCISTTTATTPPPAGSDAPNIVNATLKGKSLVVRWKGPTHYSGAVKYFRVEIIGTRSHDLSYKENKTTVVSANRTELTIDQLTPGTLYSITVQSVTSEGPGQRSQLIYMKLPVSAPLPPPKPSMVRDSVTSSSVAVILKPTSQKNGQVVAYQVILQKVTRVLRRNVESLPFRMYNYTRARENGFSYYIAAEFSGSSLPQQLIVGDSETYSGYFNAPLKPASVYRLYFRAATQGLNGPRLYGKPSVALLPRTGIDTELSSHESAGSSPFHWITFLFIAVATIFALMLVVVGSVWYRKRREKREKEDVRKHEHCEMRPTLESSEQGRLRSGTEPQNDQTSSGDYANLMLSTRRTNHKPGCSASHVYASLNQAPPQCACHDVHQSNTLGKPADQSAVNIDSEEDGKTPLVGDSEYENVTVLHDA